MEEKKMNSRKKDPKTPAVQVQRGGLRRSRRLGPQDDEGDVRRELEQEIDRVLQRRKYRKGLTQPETPGAEITLREFFETRWPSYASTHQTMNTQLQNQSKIEYLIYHIGDKSLEDCLLGNTVDLFVAAMRETGPVTFKANRDGRPRKTRTDRLSSATINKSLQILKTSLHIAYNDRLTSRPPRIKLLKQDDSRTILAPTEDEFTRLLKACEFFRTWAPYLPEVVVLAAETGMRRTEVFTLTWRSIDWDRGLIRIEEQHIFKLVDGSSWKPKNLVNREIPMSGKVRDILKLWWDGHPHEPDDVVVPSRGGAPYLTIYRSDFAEKGSGQGYFPEAVSYAGLKGIVTFHGLRHLFAVRLLTSGAPITVVSELLGHRNINQTVKQYGRYSSDAQVRFDTIKLLDGDHIGLIPYGTPTDTETRP